MRLYASFFLGLFLVGCGEEKNTEYFVKNQAEIEPTLKECSSSVEFALKTKDEKRYKEIMNSLECNSAKAAKKEVMRIQWEEEKRIREEQQKLYSEKVNKFGDELLNYEPEKLMSKAKELEAACNHFKIDEKIKYQCDGFSSKRNNIKVILVNYLVNTLNYEQVNKENISRCDGQEVYPVSLECVILNEAKKQSFVNLVSVAKSNIESLKKSYNTCFERYQKEKKSGGFSAARAVEKETECQVAHVAAKELKLVSRFSVFMNRID
ncbi:hypothetical protein ACPFUC_002992 [Vibrio cholerae]